MTEYTRVCRNCKTLNRASARFCSNCGQTIPAAIEIFVSYAHEDEAYRDKLTRQLSLQQRMGKITIWSDRDIRPGEEWEPAIKNHLLTAEVVLLLVSADFMASDYCYLQEMQSAVDRALRKEACVIPIIVRPVDWHGAPFGALQALPANAKPVSSWSSKDEAWLSAVKGIRESIKEIYGP